MSQIRVELQLDDGSFTTRVMHAGESLEHLKKRVGGTITAIREVDNASGSFLRTLGGVTIAAGAVFGAFALMRGAANGMLGDLVRVNAEFERLQQVMKGMSTAADPIADAAKQVNFLRETALQTPFSLRGLTDVFVRLRATGVDPMAGSLRSLTDAVAASGGTEEQLKRAALAISQMSGKGVIQMEELRQQLGEAIPRATELMARSMGVSYGELVQKISTGTVMAAPALQALRLEFDRTFGGSGVQQMQTLLGQFQQFQSRLQIMGTAIGDAGMNDALRKQMQDLNKFLSGSVATDFAKSVGAGFGTAITSVRSFVDTVVGMRTQIQAAGEIMLWAFGGAVLLRSIAMTSGAVLALQTGVGTLALHFATLRSVVGQVAVVTTAATGGFLAKSAALSGASVAAIFATRSLTALAGIMTALAPWVMVIGAALAFASFQWDIFGRGAKASEDSLRKFGATSEKELQDFQRRTLQMRDSSMNWGQSDLDKAKSDLDVATMGRNMIQRVTPQSSSGYRGAALLRADERVAAAQAEYDRVAAVITSREEELVRLRTAFEKREAERKADDAIRQIADQEQAIRRRYDTEGVALSKEQNDKLQAAITAEKSTEDIRKSFQERTRARQLAYYDEIAKLYIDQMTEAEKIIATTQESSDRIAAQRRKDLIQDRLNDIRKQQEEQRRMNLGIQTTPQPLDEEEMRKKARNMVSELTAKTAGLRAEMMGASSEAAKLAYQMMEIRFKGGQDNPEIARLIQQILEAQVQYERLEKMIAGQRQLDSDIKSLIRRTREEIADLEADGGDALTKIYSRVRAGLYDGVTVGGDGKLIFDSTIEAARQLQEQLAKPEGQRRVDAILNALNRSRGAMGDANTVARQLQQTLQQGVFGNQTQNAAEQFNSTLQTAVGLMERMRTLGQNPFQIMASGIPGTQGAGAAVATPTTGGDFGKFIDRLIGRESAGRADAQNPNSSARGLGQFISSTWLSYMKEMQSGLATTLSPRDQLALRDNPVYSREATEWYARRNAKSLADDGYSPTDANLYMAHHFGDAGAKKMLRADPNAMVRSILGDQAVNANPHLDGKTVAQVIAQIRGQFGDQMSVNGAGSGQQGREMSPAEIRERTAAVQGQTQATEMAAKTEEELAKARAALGERRDADLGAEVRRYGQDARRAAEEVTGLGKKETEIRQEIRRGRFAEPNQGEDRATRPFLRPEETDPNNERYAAVIAAAKAADEAAKKVEEANARRQRAETAGRQIEALGRERARQAEDARRRLENPLGPDPAQDVNLRVRRQAEETLQRIKEHHGEESEEYRRQAAVVAGIRESSANEEASKRQAALAQQNQQTRFGLLNETASAREAANARILRLQEELAQSQATGDQRVALEKRINEAIALERQKLAANGPIATTMRQWSDMGRNIEQATVGWIDGGIDALSEFATKGKMNFSKLADSILKDMLKILARGAIASKMGSAGGGLGKAGGAAKAGGGAKAPLSLGRFMTAHTGGIVGSLTASTAVSALAFAGAPRFHTGGMIRGLGLKPGEVPIVAKEGEGVFTRDQMAALGSRRSSGGITVAPTINANVNANGGDPKQNADLANQIGSQLEGVMRSVVMDEFAKAVKPNGFLEARSR